MGILHVREQDACALLSEHNGKVDAAANAHFEGPSGGDRASQRVDRARARGKPKGGKITSFFVSCLRFLQRYHRSLHASAVCAPNRLFFPMLCY